LEKSIYQNEIDIFRQSFAKLQKVPIAIYGIGQRTAMLLPGVRDFNIIGLLDRDPANIGRMISNIPVIPMHEAEAKAGAIVICADPSNYQTIFRRISSTKLPVYYANGEKAHLIKQNNSFEQNPYWEKSLPDLFEAIDGHDVIVFDIFDTLIVRKVYLPQDVFRLVSDKCILLLKNTGRTTKKSSFDFYTERVQATAQQVDSYFSLDDVYDVLQRNTGICFNERRQIEQLELDTELQAVVPRLSMADALRYAKGKGKDVWLISDMYLTKRQIIPMLLRAGIRDIPEDHILISCECKADKKSGKLWADFLQVQTGGMRNSLYHDSRKEKRKVLHIGDDPIGDDQEPRAAGIDTYPILNVRALLDNSALCGVSEKASGLQNSVVLGLICTHLLNNPMGMHESKGRPVIESCEEFGYIVLGPLFFKFLIWLRKRAKTNGNKRLLFCARDGWFLTKDMEYLEKLVGDESHAEIRYLPASRRLIFISNIHNESDLEEFARIPFIGSFKEYLYSRFNLQADIRSRMWNDKPIDPAGDANLMEMLKPYHDEIWGEVGKETLYYDSYLKENGFLDDNATDAIVDLGFNGTNQFKYEKYIGRSLKGYYFLFNFSRNNRYAATCDAEACFNEGAVNGRDSQVGRKSMVLESFLTAPYGMIRYIDADGRFVTEKDKKNQRNFQLKMQINEGVKRFIKDYSELLKPEKYNSEDHFSESLFSTLLDGRCVIAPEVLEAFYFDNDIVGPREIRVEV